MQALNNSSVMMVQKGHCNDLEAVQINKTGDFSSAYNLPLNQEQDKSRDDVTKAIKKKAVRIFTIDGGGGRVKYSLTLAARMERELGSHIKLGKVFDLFGGTSAGAIVTVMLNKPSSRDPTVPIYSARKINEKFEGVLNQVFPHNFCSKITQVYNIVVNKAKFDKKGINACFNKYLGDTLLQNSLNEIVIPTYQPSLEMRTWFITRKIAREQPFFQDLTLKKMLLMTTSAPTYFDAEEYKGLYFMDGGMFANNPTEATWRTANNYFGHNSDRVICSLGTGISPTTIDIHPSHPTGIYTIAPDAIDLFMNASEQRVHQDMLHAFGPDKNYYRWQSQIKPIDLADGSPETMAYLEEKAKEMLDDPHNQERWEEMLQELRKAENTEPHAQPVQLYS